MVMGLLTSQNLFIFVSGDADLDAKHKQSTATKYFSDLLQMTLMYCEDLCTIEPFLSRLREITADGMPPLLLTGPHLVG